MSHPRSDVTTKINPNTPTGARCIAKPMIFAIASPTASSTRTSGRALSSGISVRAAPKTNAKKMIPSMSRLGAAGIGDLPAIGVEQLLAHFQGNTDAGSYQIDKHDADHGRDERRQEEVAE